MKVKQLEWTQFFNKWRTSDGYMSFLITFEDKILGGTYTVGKDENTVYTIHSTLEGAKKAEYNIKKEYILSNIEEV